jgi:hypothetical protein
MAPIVLKHRLGYLRSLISGVEESTRKLPEELAVSDGLPVQASPLNYLGRRYYTVTGWEKEGSRCQLSEVDRPMHNVKRFLSVKGERYGRAPPKLVENILARLDGRFPCEARNGEGSFSGFPIQRHSR